MERAEQKCCVKDCEVRGEPEAGEDFFLCEYCIGEFAKKLEQAQAKRCERHARN